MKSNQAAHYFHGEEGYNCAQSVLKTFQQERNISEMTIHQATALGGGRAEGGICGAIYAALLVSDNDEAAEDLLHQFHKKTGSIYCVELKQSEEGCRELVKIAATLASEKVENE